MITELDQAIRDAERARLDYATHGLAKPGIAIDLAGALAVLLDALSTPPADDVREALEKLIDLNDPRGLARPVSAVTAILAAFEVRPRGTVTDAEVLRAKAAALTEFADAVRMPFTVFRGDNGEPITPGDLMRETAARYLAEAAQEARS